MITETKTTWLHINKLFRRGKDNHGTLLHFIVNGLHWELNYRGDSPLLIYHTNGIKHVLQIDGDLFYPIDVNLYDVNNSSDAEFDSYLFNMEQILEFINTMLYEDMELEYNDDEDDETAAPDYYLYYGGKNESAFKLFEDKVAKGERILEEDIEALK